MKIVRAAAVAVAAAQLVVAGAVVAYADDGSSSNEPVSTDQTLTIDGRTFGPEDGLETMTEQHEITPGGDPIAVPYGEDGATESELLKAQWGSSYAISRDVTIFKYEGSAKAAANVYNGKRIVQVCFWYSRTTPVSSKKCSTAHSTGTHWNSGTVVRHSVWDDLNPWRKEKTIFNIQTSRVDPKVY